MGVAYCGVGGKLFKGEEERGRECGVCKHLKVDDVSFQLLQEAGDEVGLVVELLGVQRPVAQSTRQGALNMHLQALRRALWRLPLALLPRRAGALCFGERKGERQSWWHGRRCKSGLWWCWRWDGHGSRQGGWRAWLSKCV